MFIAQCGNGSNEIAARWQNTILYQINVSWVLYVKFRREKHCLVKHSAFLKNVCYKYLQCKFCASSHLLFFFYELLIGPQPTFFWNVLLFSCNLIGQLFLSGPGYCGRTVSQPTLTPAVQDLPHSLRASMIVPCLLSFINNILRSHQ